MSRIDFEQLVERYADGRPICNCRQAYYTPCGEGIDAVGNKRTDLPACAGGCSANKIGAKEYIAARVVAEFNLK